MQHFIAPLGCFTKWVCGGDLIEILNNSNENPSICDRVRLGIEFIQRECWVLWRFWLDVHNTELKQICTIGQKIDPDHDFHSDSVGGSSCIMQHQQQPGPMASWACAGPKWTKLGPQWNISMSHSITASVRQREKYVLSWLYGQHYIIWIIQLTYAGHNVHMYDYNYNKIMIVITCNQNQSLNSIIALNILHMLACFPVEQYPAGKRRKMFSQPVTIASARILLMAGSWWMD